VTGERGHRPGEDSGAGRIGLIVDSTVLLRADEVARVSRDLDSRFAIVPLTVLVDDEPHVDGALPPQELCRAMEEGARASTSMPAPDDFARAIADLAVAGADHVLILTISRALSGTHDSAVRAGASAEVPVTVLDSATTSAAAGGAALLIADGAARGRGVAALRAAAEDYLREETQTLFCPATLEHLERGGRIGRAASLVGRALSIVPVLGLADGIVDTRARVRTLRKAHARMIAESLATARSLGDCEIVVLVSEGSLDAAGDDARAVHDELAEAAEEAGWLLSEGVLSPVIVAHVGPGAVGVVVRGRS
jgi:DegV family protein with EDD domain